MRAIDADAFDERVRVAGGMSEEELTEDFKDGVQAVLYMLSKQPTIQPDNGLQKLADEIATFKRCVKSENSDYLTGYLCALSAVEGMIAERREVTE